MTYIILIWECSKTCHRFQNCLEKCFCDETSLYYLLKETALKGEAFIKEGKKKCWF